MKIAVIGIGQSLRGDDAAGVEAVRRWQTTYPETAYRPEVRVELSELPGLALLDLLDGVEAAILVDSVQSSGFPGSMYSFNLEQLSAFPMDSKSAHGWGVAETLNLDRILNPARRAMRIRLIGIEADDLRMGTGLSRAVEKGLPLACKAIEDQVQALLQD